MKEIFKNRNENFVSDYFKIEIHSFCKNQSTLKHRIKWFSDKGLLYSLFKNHKKDLNIHWSYFFRVDKWSWYFSYDYLLSTNIIEWFCSKPKKNLPIDSFSKPHFCWLCNNEKRFLVLLFPNSNFFLNLMFKKERLIKKLIK